MWIVDQGKFLQSTRRYHRKVFQRTKNLRISQWRTLTNGIHSSILVSKLSVLCEELGEVRAILICFWYVLCEWAILICFWYVLCEWAILICFWYVLCEWAILICFWYVLCEWAILICFWYVSFHTDYPILDNLFELCPFQTVLPHENHIDGFFLTHTQPPEIINFDISFALPE